VINIDNVALVSILHMQTVRDKRVMNLVHLFVLYLLQHNIFFKTKHVADLKNYIACSIS